MFTSQIVKDLTGQHYIICLRHFSMQTQALKPEKFANSQASFQFVTSLQAPFGLWQSIASASSFFDFKGWQNNHTHLAIEHYVAEALQQGFVEVYKAASPNQHMQSTALRSFVRDGTSYKIELASVLLIGKNSDVVQFSSQRDVGKLLFDLVGINSSHLEAIAEGVNLPIMKSNPGIIEVSDAIEQALLKGELVIIEEPVNNRTTKSLEEIILEDIRNSVNDQPAPASAVTYLEEDVKDDVCTFDSFKLHCKHKGGGGRKYELDVINKGPNHNESQYALQVISLPKDPDYIGVRFNGICRNGSDTCGSIKISGPNQSKVTKDNPYAFNVRTKQQNKKAKSFTNFIAQYLRPTIGDGLIPEKYIVETQSCTGADTYKALVQTFPNFYWVGEIGVAYLTESNKNEWKLYGKLIGNVDNDEWRFDTSQQGSIGKFFPKIQDSFADTISKLDEYSQNMNTLDFANGLVKFDVTWPSVAIGGELRLSESSKSYEVGLEGSIYLNLSPLIKAEVSIDIFDILAAKLGGPILLKYKTMAQEGKKHAVVLKAVLALTGEIRAFLKWEKSVDDTWLLMLRSSTKLSLQKPLK